MRHGRRDSQNVQQSSADAICRTLVQAATDNELPIEFFMRLTGRGEPLNPGTVSPKGAAQSMPRTAMERGLTDPFEPLQAPRESVSYLRELRTTFRGNLELAAAA
jgi:hypothetical protein